MVGITPRAGLPRPPLYYLVGSKEAKSGLRKLGYFLEIWLPLKPFGPLQIPFLDPPMNISISPKRKKRAYVRHLEQPGKSSLQQFAMRDLRSERRAASMRCAQQGPASDTEPLPYRGQHQRYQ